MLLEVRKCCDCSEHVQGFHATGVQEMLLLERACAGVPCYWRSGNVAIAVSMCRGSMLLEFRKCCDCSELVQGFHAIGGQEMLLLERACAGVSCYWSSGNVTIAVSLCRGSMLLEVRKCLNCSEHVQGFHATGVQEMLRLERACAGVPCYWRSGNVAIAASLCRGSMLLDVHRNCSSRENSHKCV